MGRIGRQDVDGVHNHLKIASLRWATSACTGTRLDRAQALIARSLVDLALCGKPVRSRRSTVGLRREADRCHLPKLIRASPGLSRPAFDQAALIGTTLLPLRRIGVSQKSAQSCIIAARLSSRSPRR